MVRNSKKDENCMEYGYVCMHVYMYVCMYAWETLTLNPKPSQAQVCILRRWLCKFCQVPLFQEFLKSTFPCLLHFAKSPTEHEANIAKCTSHCGLSEKELQKRPTSSSFFCPFQSLLFFGLPNPLPQKIILPKIYFSHGLPHPQTPSSYFPSFF